MALEPLTQEQEDRLLAEINYSRPQLRKDILQLREWLTKQPHLPPCRLDESDIFLSNFLVGCKGSIDTAAKKLDYYYSVRGKGEVFTNRDKPDYLDTCRTFVALTQLPQNTKDGSRVYLAKLTNSDLSVFDSLAYIKSGLLTFEHRMRCDGILEAETYVIDCADFTLSHFFKVSPTNLRAFLSFFLNVYPLRVKKILVVNAPPVLATALNNILLPMLSAKMKSRYFITRDPLEKVADFIDILPSEYEGGKGKPIEIMTDEWFTALKKTLEGISSQLHQEVNENKRPLLQGQTDNPYFGLHGSIKTLVID